MALVDLVKVLLTEAGISGRLNPYRLRHNYATLTASKTGNMALTRAQLGHTNIATARAPSSLTLRTASGPRGRCC